MFFFDLSASIGHTSASPQKDMAREFRKDDLCPTHGLFTRLRISPMCPAIQRPLQDQTFLLLEPISLYGLRSTDVSGEPSRHRSMSSFGSTKTLSYGFPRKCLAQYFGSCQPSQRLANLCRLCSNPYWPCSAPLRQRFLRHRSESNRLCLGFYHHRSMPVTFPLGQVSDPQRGRKTTHPLGSSRKHSPPCHYYSWQDSRCQHTRPNDLRARRFLYYRQRLSRLYPTLQDSSNPLFLCHPNQKQLPVQTTLLSACRQIHRSPMRSNHRLRRILLSKSLSRQIAPDSLLRCQPEQTARFSHQQLYSSGINHCQLFRCRWHIELFFKWIKQHLRIKAFYGTTENAVKTQICIASPFMY
jgi:hypothetical protein